ncbi:MAG: 2-aminoethylphosphonate--pyruvate transaminase [Syntrophobacteraceae bacterium]
MDIKDIPENPYILLTPGPLSTTRTVRGAMLRDWCTWDEDYNGIIQDIRRRLVTLATSSPNYTSVLMQGSGTFCVESVIGSVLPENGKLLVLVNGAYGARIAQIAERLKIPVSVIDSGETRPCAPQSLEETLRADASVTHVAVVHCETTTGMLNPVLPVGRVAKQFGKTFIVDAMSSFGGIPLDMAALGADFLISSANKCIQGVPGFGFVIAERTQLEKTAGWARSLSLDLFDQWRTMELHGGKWRFTSPTHVVRAFAQALDELEEECGIEKRYNRYQNNHNILVDGMQRLGFDCLLPETCRSPIITAFRSPQHPAYDFKKFYSALKSRGFVIYPGKVTAVDTFRIGNIGDVFVGDILRLLEAVKESMFW